MLTPEAAKEQLKKKGWSYRTAAERIGIHYMQIYAVVNRKVTSAPILRAIESLPTKRNGGHHQ